MKKNIKYIVGAILVIPLLVHLFYKYVLGPAYKSPMISDGPTDTYVSASMPQGQQMPKDGHLQGQAPSVASMIDDSTNENQNNLGVLRPSLGNYGKNYNDYYTKNDIPATDLEKEVQGTLESVAYVNAGKKLTSNTYRYYVDNIRKRLGGQSLI